MNEQLARKLQQVGNQFNLPGPFFSYEEINTGNVNHTYRTDYIRDDGTGMARIKSYLVQQVNTYAFRDPVALMENIDKVTEYIHAQNPGQTCLHYHHTTDRNTFIFDGDEFWRVCNYIPSVTFDTCDDLDIVRSAAEAFGDFQVSLANFDASQLHYTIPDFHNTRKRYAALREAAEKDPAGRKKDVPGELAWLLSVEDTACRLTDLAAVGKLPLRVTHNDTKLNNVLLDQETGAALCVVDLDTVMPGLAAYDFGEAVRTGACTAPEDERDLSKIQLSLPMYRAYAEGFLSQLGDTMTRDEVLSLPRGARMMTLENAMRFLADYLNGDVYFAVHRKDHNLDRARAQMTLLRRMEEHWDEMQSIL